MEVAEASQRIDVMAQILNLPPEPGTASPVAGTQPFSQTLNSTLQTVTASPEATTGTPDSPASEVSADAELQVLFALAAMTTHPAAFPPEVETLSTADSPDAALPQGAVLPSPTIPFFPPATDSSLSMVTPPSAPTVLQGALLFSTSEETGAADPAAEKSEKDNLADASTAVIVSPWVKSFPLPTSPSIPTQTEETGGLSTDDVVSTDVAATFSVPGNVSVSPTEPARPAAPSGFAEALSGFLREGAQAQSPAASSSGANSPPSTADELLEAIARAMDPSAEKEDDESDEELPVDIRLKRKETEAKAAAQAEQPSTIVTPSLIPALMASTSVGVAASSRSTPVHSTAVSSSTSDSSSATPVDSRGLEIAAVLPGAAAGATDDSDLPAARPPIAAIETLHTPRHIAPAEAVTTPTVSPQDAQTFADRLSQYVLQSSDRGEQMTVMIAPPDLGSIRIDVQSGADGLMVRFEASNAVTEQLLVDRMPQLHEALAQVGRTADRVDVVRAETAMGGQGSGTQDGRAAGQQQFAEQRQQPAWLPSADPVPPPSEVAPAATKNNTDRLQGLNIRI